jgi:hypothetical protein
MKNEADNKALLLSGDNQSSEVSHSEWHCFSLLLAVYMVVIIAAFAAVVEYPPSFTAEQDIQYVFYLNVTVMMLVGFGFLMTFQRQNRLTAVGMTVRTRALNFDAPARQTLSLSLLRSLLGRLLRLGALAPFHRLD